MAASNRKVTYSLKPETVKRVRELAKAWGVTKSEVIRRAIDRFGVLGNEKQEAQTPLEALKWFQKNGVSAKVADKWNAEIRRTRRESGIAMSRRSEKA